MARKIPVKLVMKYRDQGLSRNMIAKTQKVGKSSVSEVFKRAEELQLCYQDIESLTDIEAYRRFFPERYQSEILYDAPNYDDIHKELQRVGVTLKILWQEYVDRCRTKESIAVGYSKFCDDYQKHIAKYRLTNHLTHKTRGNGAGGLGRLYDAVSRFKYWRSYSSLFICRNVTIQSVYLCRSDIGYEESYLAQMPCQSI